MKTFSPSEAAFEGFRLIGRRPGLVIVWALLHLVFAALVIALAWAVFAPEIPSVMAQIAAAKTAAEGNADPSWAMPLVMKVRGFQWTVQPLGWAAGTVFTCAVYRVLIRPNERGLAYIRFGGDELRLLALTVIYFVLGFIAVFVLVLVGVFVGAGIYVAIAKTGQGAWVGWVAAGAGLIGFCTVIWVIIRLSLAWPISFAEKRLAIFDSWRLTRGQVWRIFGCYLLTWIFAIVLSLATLAVFGVVLMFGGAAIVAAVQSGSTPDWAKLAPLLIPLGVVWGLVAAGVSAMIRVVMAAPAMAIYRALTTRGEPSVSPGEGQPFRNPPGVLVL